MSLFQNSVINKYLKGLDSEKVNIAFERFKTHFHNPTIQENIRNSKEEQYQGEFLIDLFVNVLGYTKNPTPNFNLTTELKNIRGSKKTDGAILDNNGLKPIAKAVIELKGTNTTDLSKIETQAFGYKNNQTGCNYVITSNFEKLRFYIDNAVDFEEFNLFQLTKERFDMLWICLSSEYLLKDIPKKIKDESLTQEENITKKLYKDYALFRNEIFDAIQKENPEYDKLTLFKKTQKLLDRFLFIFFAEDRLLLPPNSIRAILKQWTDLRDKYDEYFPLYDRFKKYFGYMNTGHKGQQHDIFAYNGGLFAPDDILDNIKINDDLLYKHTLNLSDYDFESEVSVNILGHIFEHSLNDIDEIQSEIQGVATEQSKTLPSRQAGKRKKDGVFYTPKYITKYIVDNTVGKLCEEKKTELDIQEAEYEKERKGRKSATLKNLTQKLDDYRKWLLQITICDPACGSGAFLNQALEFLIKEHQYIDELQAKLFGDAMVLSEVENSILENNLFGVDINDESVDIAKLSLWLRTAQKGRKLTSLNNNIKCGNSLIDDPTVAGDKAFNWQNEFPEVFKEKNKKPFHITTALHDSRTSQRMIDYKVRQKRDLGTNPLPNFTKLTKEEEILISETILDIVKEDQLNIMAYNVCGDHMHILLVCEEDEVPKIMQKLKAKTARAVNVAKGITSTREHAPLPTTDDNDSTTREHAPLPKDAPLPRGKKQNSLWTQKYGCKPIKDDDQLYNTVAYIQNNRVKHELPINKELQSLLDNPILNQNYNEVFAPEYKGGFDVVIGNPPYGAKLDKLTQNYLNQKYIKGGSETAISFIKLSHSILLETNGKLGFIIPKSFSFSSNYDSIRKYLLRDINEIIDCKKVWKEVKLEQIMFFLSKDAKQQYYFSGILDAKQIIKLGEINKDTFHEFGFYLNGISKVELEIGRKINYDKQYISDIATNSRGGIFQKSISESGDTTVLGGAEIQREGIKGIKGYVDYQKIKDDKKCFINENSVLVQNIVSHIENPIDHIKITACFTDERNFAIVDTVNQITFNNDFNAKLFWLLFNSKLINWYSYRFILAKAIRTIHFDSPITSRIPIPFKFNQQPFIEKADQMLTLNKELQSITQNFIDLLKSKISMEKFTTKLQNWHELDFREFLKELEKTNKKSNKGASSLAQQAEWMQYFKEQKEKVQILKTEIHKTDNEIDQMVYELYGLTEEEIKIVEEATA